MNCLVLLILFEIIILISAMILFRCDIFAPSVIVSFVFLVSTLVLATNYFEWSVHICLNTTIIIVTALLSFMLIGFLFYNSKEKNKRVGVTISTIDISKYKIVISLIFEILICIFYYREVVRIASYVTQDWGMGMIWKYRQMAFYTDRLTKDQMMSTWVTQGYKLTMIIAYIMLFVFINNVIVNKEKASQNYKYIILIPAYVFMVLLAGNRLALMNMFFFAVMSWYILKTIKVGVSIKTSSKYILRFLGIAILVIVIFWVLTSVVQRYTKLPFWTTLSIYAGAPIQLLNEYIIQPVEHNQVWGQESLINIYNSLYKLGLTDYHGIINLEVRTYNGVSLGNVYTTLRRFIQDYGFIGMLFSISLVSAFYNWLYYKKIRKIKEISYKSSMQIIIYSFMAYPLFLFSIEEYFTLMWSFGYLVTLALFYCMFYFYTSVSLVKEKIRVKRW